MGMRIHVYILVNINEKKFDTYSTQARFFENVDSMLD